MSLAETSRSISLAAIGASGRPISMSTAAFVNLQSEQGVDPRQLLEDCLLPGVQLVSPEVLMVLLCCCQYQDSIAMHTTSSI